MQCDFGAHDHECLIPGVFGVRHAQRSELFSRYPNNIYIYYETVNEEFVSNEIFTCFDFNVMPRLSY